MEGVGGTAVLWVWRCLGLVCVRVGTLYSFVCERKPSKCFITSTRLSTQHVRVEKLNQKST